MRRLFLAVMCAVAIAITGVGAAGTAVASQDTSFGGTWTSTDLDGSTQVLTIRGSGQGALAIFLFDDSATGACGVSPAHVVGSGVPDGDTLVMYGTLTCLPGGNVLRFRITFTLEYVPGADVLVDESGVVWHRA